MIVKKENATVIRTQDPVSLVFCRFGSLSFQVSVGIVLGQPAPQAPGNGWAALRAAIGDGRRLATPSAAGLAFPWVIWATWACFPEQFGQSGLSFPSNPSYLGLLCWVILSE